ncbi:hypothetical protein M9Y10_037089 [Tritrichomonas musculus]|uniref:Protein kinase domain-containing protein n=1 Tax=Tritrichomonas musculus TaxID=1915356 RepID=A0ABR2GSX0_9EUKA
MQEIAFTRIPDEDEILLDSIDDAILDKIYSQFDFLYFNSSDSYDPNQIGNYLHDYLYQFKFITYQITARKENQNDNLENVDIILCVEGKCLIIKNINIQVIDSVILRLKTKNLSILNLSQIIRNEQSFEENLALEETINFLRYFSKIKKKSFIMKTILPIIGYIIRRHFYPSNFFKDPSFFNFNQQNNSIESSAKNNFRNFILSTNHTEKKINFIQLIKSLNQLKNNNNNNNNNINTFEFKKDDFIILRPIYLSFDSSYDLVMHKESLHVMVLKRILNSYNDHEIIFCQNYSHRCFCPFYGFVRENGDIIGFAYQLMSNGSIKKFYDKNKMRNNFSLFQLISINRIFQGIQYLQSESLIHRNLKPGNILLDHDNIPYICDFETIRLIHNDDDDANLEMTNDIGSPLYTSPEQDAGYDVSFPTDIYSFGMIIYFLIEKKNRWNDYSSVISEKNDKTKVSKLSNASFNLQVLYDSCTKVDLHERAEKEQIQEIISDEIISFDYLVHFLLNSNDIVFDEPQISQFFYECFYFLVNSQEKWDKCMNNLFFFQPLFKYKIEGNDSSLYLELANDYFNGKCVKQNYFKAREFYELSANFNNHEALVSLGKIYEFGLGVNKDDLKAKEYYERAAQIKHF